MDARTLLIFLYGCEVKLKSDAQHKPRFSPPSRLTPRLGCTGFNDGFSFFWIRDDAQAIRKSCEARNRVWFRLAWNRSSLHRDGTIFLFTFSRGTLFEQLHLERE